MPSMPETFLGAAEKVKQLAHTTYIRPIVKYASPVWDPHTKRNTNKIEMVQRRCARYVTGNYDRTWSVTSLLNCLNWPTLEEGRRQYCLAVMHRILHNQVDIHWQSFHTKTSSCTRGHSCRLFLPFCKNHVFVSSFFPAPAKTGITLPSIQQMQHPLTPLSGIWGIKMPRYLSVLFVMPCFLLTPPPLMLCVYFQTFEASLFWKRKKKTVSITQDKAWKQKPFENVNGKMSIIQENSTK